MLFQDVKEKSFLKDVIATVSSYRGLASSLTHQALKWNKAEAYKHIKGQLRSNKIRDGLRLDNVEECLLSPLPRSQSSG